MIIFNLVGIAIFAVSFGLATALGNVFGHTSEGLLMTIAGPLSVALDLAYRKFVGKHWTRPGAGGSLFFLPVWGLGILWTILGIYYQLRG